MDAVYKNWWENLTRIKTIYMYHTVNFVYTIQFNTLSLYFCSLSLLLVHEQHQLETKIAFSTVIQQLIFTQRIVHNLHALSVSLINTVQ